MIVKVNNKTLKVKSKNSPFQIIKFGKNSVLPPDVDRYSIICVSDNELMGTTFGSGIYLSESNVTIRAIPNIGYEFSHWSDNDTTAERTIIVNNDMTLTAYFKRKINVGVLSYVPNNLYVNPYEDPKQDLTI